MPVSESARAEAVENSALWAAYGDALGFMTELAHDTGHVRARVGVDEVRRLSSWTRRIGGRLGVKVELPPGCYSDDTQLRLATARAIRRDGSFDVEAFSKVELPVWLSYSLGAGRGTKAAAAALTTRKSGWSTNFFQSREASYIAGGGNGAAMRIQPHVWAAPSPRYRASLKEVIRNAVCTHGHPRGIAGAVLHSAALGLVMDTGEPISPDRWGEFVQAVEVIPEVVLADEVLHLAWLPLWEQAQRESVQTCFAAVARECTQDLAVLEESVGRGVDEYQSVVHAIGAGDPTTRGSGTKTALLALLLAWWAAKVDPSDVLTAAANALASDTDTISTMTGALIGAAFKNGLVDPPELPMDHQYIRSDARRLSHISSRRRTNGDFPYPDLLHWSPPKNQTDALGVWEGEPCVAGLGSVELTSEPIIGGGTRRNQWQWAHVWFGQNLFIKRRPQLPTLSPQSNPGSAQRRQPEPVEDRTPATATEDSERLVRNQSQGDLFESPAAADAPHKRRRLTLEAAIEIAESRDYAANTVGALLLQLADQEGGADLAVAFAAVVARSRPRNRGRGSRR